MDKRELEKDWLANNALIAFIGALLMGQQWQMSEGTAKIFFVLEVPDYSWLVILAIIAFMFCLSMFLALGTFIEPLRVRAFRWRAYYSPLLGVLVWIAFILSWLSLFSELPLDQWWSLVFLLGGFLFSFVFIPLRFIFIPLRSLPSRSRQRGPCQDTRSMTYRLKQWLTKRVRRRRTE